MRKNINFWVALVCCVIFVAVAAVVAHGQTKPSPPTVPTLTTEQKFEIRDLQAKDGEVTTAILRTQLQATQRIQELTEQKKGYEDQLTRTISGLCKSDDGKRYQLNPSDLSCAPAPEPPKQPEKK
jgi:hypothetical protein